MSPGFGGIGNAGFLGDRDTSLFQEDALSNGSGEHLFAGRTGFGALRRALIEFDVAGGTIPPGTTITAAGVTMQCTKSSPGDGPRNFSLHRVTADWGEAGSDAGDPGGIGAPALPGDATWTERFVGQPLPWATPGGDFVATASATATVGECDETNPTAVVFLSSAELVADIQTWLDDPDSNFGWILIGEEDEDFSARRFSSADHDQLPQVPKLDVAYEIDDEPVPAAGPGVAALLVLLVGTAAALGLRRAPRDSPPDRI
jgi:hypothetical protein